MKALKLMVALVWVVAGAWQVANAIPIVITVGNPGNAGTDNVLFNDDTLVHSGTLVQGNFNGSGAGYIVDFTSSSGTGEIYGGGGQAEIHGGTGNDPFTSLTFGLENGATFTKAILNVGVVNDPKTDGTILFKVSYIDAAGSPYSETFPVAWNGNNYFGIVATTAKISQITFSTSDVAFHDAQQFRLGGFAPVPDGGTTALLLGMATLGLGYWRRR